MAELAREGVRAGALGISTTRLLAHRTSRRGDVPGTFADARELAALGAVLRELGTGVFEIVPRGMDGEISPEAHAEIDMMGELAERSAGRSCSRSSRRTPRPTGTALQLDRCAQLRAEGVADLPPGGQSHDRHPDRCATAGSTRSRRGRATGRSHIFRSRERVARMRDPEVKARILAESNEWAPDQAFAHFLHETFDRMYEIGDPIDWEPSTEDAVGPRARRAGREPQELLYDIFTAG